MLRKSGTRTRGSIDIKTYTTESQRLSCIADTIAIDVIEHDTCHRGIPVISQVHSLLRRSSHRNRDTGTCATCRDISCRNPARTHGQTSCWQSRKGIVSIAARALESIHHSSCSGCATQGDVHAIESVHLSIIFHSILVDINEHTSTHRTCLYIAKLCIDQTSCAQDIAT